jgi:hypothetical protein
MRDQALDLSGSERSLTAQTRRKIGGDSPPSWCVRSVKQESLNMPWNGSGILILLKKERL